MELIQTTHNIDKNNCFLSCTLMRFYTKEKEDILNYYNSHQHRSCNTRSDQRSLKPHIQFLRAALFLSTSLFSPFWLFNPWLLLLHHQLSLTTILTSSFSFPFNTLYLRGTNIFVESINSVLSHGKSVMNGENMKMLFILKHYLPAFPRDGDNVNYTTHELWLGTRKSSVNHKCSQIMDFLIGSVM